MQGVARGFGANLEGVDRVAFLKELEGWSRESNLWDTLPHVDPLARLRQGSLNALPSSTYALSLTYQYSNTSLIRTGRAVGICPNYEKSEITV